MVATRRRSVPGFRVWLVVAGICGAVAILLPAARGGGVAGAVLGAVVALCTAGLLPVGWVLLRWRAGVRGRCGAALLLLLALLAGGLGAAVLAGGTVQATSYTAATQPLTPDDRYVCVIVCDGASLIEARKLLMKGLPAQSRYADVVSKSFPTISRLFIQQGAYTARGISVWPSSSVPAHTGIMTGCYPRRTGVMGQRQFNPGELRHTSYIGLGINRIGELLPKSARTLFEYFPRARSLAVVQICHRGASLFVPTPPDDAIAIGKLDQVMAASDRLGRLSGRSELPRTMVITLCDIDHQTHNNYFDDKRSIATYLRQDKEVAQIVDLYRTRGLYDRTLFVICADHGMEEVYNHVTIDNVMLDLRFDVFQSLKWSVVREWGAFEANFWVGRKSLFVSKYNAVALWGGSSDALVYVRGQQRGPGGEVVRESWSQHPTDQELHHYHIGGADVDVIQRLMDYSPGIGLVLTNPAPSVFGVYCKTGEARIEERSGGGQIEFRYRVVRGTDPLGYSRNPALRPVIAGGSWLRDAQWAELTYMEYYPDALRRIAYTFGNPSSGHMDLVASEGWDFAPYYVTPIVPAGSHGNLDKFSSLVPIMFHGPGIQPGEMPYARTVDILPTILAWLGKQAEGADGRPLPVLAGQSGEAAYDGAGVDLGDWRYRLEHRYASYDRGLVRVHRRSGKREVVCASLLSACPNLPHRPNTTLELMGVSGGRLRLRVTYPGDSGSGPEVLLDPAALRAGGT